MRLDTVILTLDEYIGTIHEDAGEFSGDFLIGVAEAWTEGGGRFDMGSDFSDSGIFKHSTSSRRVKFPIEEGRNRFGVV